MNTLVLIAYIVLGAVAFVLVSIVGHWLRRRIWEVVNNYPHLSREEWMEDWDLIVYDKDIEPTTTQAKAPKPSSDPINASDFFSKIHQARPTTTSNESSQCCTQKSVQDKGGSGE